MKRITTILAALLVAGLLAFAAGCSTSHRVLHVEDHPSGKTTLLETLTMKHQLGGLYTTSQYNYWECQRTEAGLDCHQVCWNFEQFGARAEGVAEDAPACRGYIAAAE